MCFVAPEHARYLVRVVSPDGSVWEVESDGLLRYGTSLRVAGEVADLLGRVPLPADPAHLHDLWVDLAGGCVAPRRCWAEVVERDAPSDDAPNGWRTVYVTPARVTPARNRTGAPAGGVGV